MFLRSIKHKRVYLYHLGPGWQQSRDRCLGTEFVSCRIRRQSKDRWLGTEFVSCRRLQQSKDRWLGTEFVSCRRRQQSKDRWRGNESRLHALQRNAQPQQPINCRRHSIGPMLVAINHCLEVQCTYTSSASTGPILPED